MVKIYKNKIKKALFNSFVISLPVVFNYKQQAVKAHGIGLSVAAFRKAIIDSGNYTLLAKNYYCRNENVNLDTGLAIKEYLDFYSKNNKKTKDIIYDITTLCILHRVTIDDFIRDLELIQIQ